MNLGWECPKCGRCYSPSTPECLSCGKEGKAASRADEELLFPTEKEKRDQDALDYVVRFLETNPKGCNRRGCKAIIKDFCKRCNDSKAK